jgi:hypothetical protein
MQVEKGLKARSVQNFCFLGLETGISKQRTYHAPAVRRSHFGPESQRGECWPRSRFLILDTSMRQTGEMIGKLRGKIWRTESMGCEESALSRG